MGGGEKLYETINFRLSYTKTGFFVYETTSEKSSRR